MLRALQLLLVLLREGIQVNVQFVCTICLMVKMSRKDLAMYAIDKYV
jgi:hypothetical protein